MWVLGSCINAQVLHLTTAERATWNHALNCLLNNALWETAFENLARSALFDATWMSGVPVVLLVSIFLASQDNLVGIDDDDIVAIVNMRSEGSLMLATQAIGDDSGKTTDNETFRVDQNPFLYHFGRLLGESCH